MYLTQLSATTFAVYIRMPDGKLAFLGAYSLTE